MPNRRLMDYMMRKDMRRNPYGSEGGDVTSRDPRHMRRDSGMHEGYRMDRPMDYTYEHEMDDGRRRRNVKGQYMSDRAYNMPHERDYGSFHEERGFKPVEAMGYFTGYYGGGQDYRGRDMRYDMGYDPYYHYPMMQDHRYDMAGDYGEKLTKEELEHWRKKLEREVGDEQSKNFFRKENVEQRARQLGVEMKDFNAEELSVCAYMIYSDYAKSLKPYVGQNMDVFIKMGSEFLTDPDSAVKGGEKLALYYEIVSEGGDD